ncbi:uncharacterized protein BN787_01227 [Clostridium sp. CAG:798]|nr:uncharacterized protein BN787_01227 [Clostridium sp. CAG:798]
MVYTEYSIEKAKARETNKVLKYNNDINYIEHFKMIFEKEKVKLYLKEEDYISNYKVPYNEITRRIKKELNNSSDIYADWKKFDENKALVDMADNCNCYPAWVKYDWKNNSLVYNEEFIKRNKEAILKNLNLNLKFYTELDSEEFNKNLDKVLKLKKNNGLKKVTDLKEYIGKKGIYIMVLDKYKQIYIGQSKRDVVERIINHWKRKVEFENLLIGKVNESKLSIDTFGMLDTTRIYIEDIDPLYYNNSEKIDKREEYLINSIPEQYLINKVGGGLRLDGIDSLKSFIDTYKKRKLD